MTTHAKKYNRLDALIFKRDGGIKLDVKKLLQRPEAQKRIDAVGEIAERAIAERRARLAREQGDDEQAQRKK